MTEVKIAGGKLPKGVAGALAPYVDELFRDRSGRWIAVVELVHDDRTEPGLSDDGEPTKEAVVKLRIAAVELAIGEDEHHVRSAQRALYTKRTTGDTLDELDGGLDQADGDLRNAAGLISGPFTPAS